MGPNEPAQPSLRLMPSHAAMIAAVQTERQNEKACNEKGRRDQLSLTIIIVLCLLRLQHVSNGVANLVVVWLVCYLRGRGLTLDAQSLSGIAVCSGNREDTGLINNFGMHQTFCLLLPELPELPNIPSM